ncbi:maltokinase [Streptomyces sp. SAI-170]|uniref:maltokinase N-terminal cap-like domain-containing protein n=1 Tax=Streptomyces sp. SAI-170 TaxID=3377729 RepID=UPI003C7E1C88
MTAPAAAEACPTCLDARTLARGDELLGALLPVLLPWLTTRRWYAHAAGCLTRLTPVRSTVVHEDGSAALLHTLLDAHHSSGARHRYQLVLGLRPAVPAALAPAVVGRAEGGRWAGWWLYEATEDPALMTALLHRLPAGDDSTAPGPRLTLTGAVPLTAAGTPRPLSAEQSNTSVAYGDRLLLKLVRQPAAGDHPETDTLRALTGHGYRGTARLAGWLHTEGPGLPATVLGVLTEYLPNEGDGWSLATAHAARCVTGSCPTVPATGGFTDDARALGAEVAALHTALAEVFGHHPTTGQRVTDQVARMRRRLRETVREVPGLEPYTGRVLRLYDDYAAVAERGGAPASQRIHGDLHLGQVLRTPDGWKIIDFEGEPSRPLAERTLPEPALRDVAGMLRSFDYAAQEALDRVRVTAVPDGPVRPLHRARRGYAWAVRNRRAFIAGYASAGGLDPRVHPVLLRALEADKAVYEARYEAEHRPDRLTVPLAALTRLTSGR